MNAAVTPFVEAMRASALPASGIAWLDEQRREAMQAFVARGLPDTRSELWKYTSLRALAQRPLQARDAAAATRALPRGLLPSIGGDAPRVVFVNGTFRADLSMLDGLPEGVSLRPLPVALREQPEPLRFQFAGRAESDDGCTLLNRALAEDGVVVQVAAGVHVAEPLHLVHVAVAAGPEHAWHLRNFIDVGDGARLDLVEHFVGEAGAAQLGNLVNDITLRDAAQLHWTTVQVGGVDATLLRRSDCRLGEDAMLDFHALELGGKLARHELRIELAGARARFASRGAFVLHGRQHADTEVLVTHRGRDTVSDSSWRGVADGRARGVVHGRILVQPGADGADGSFYNKNLLLSPDAEIDTRPALEIYADDVKANHGATVGQLDEKALFYLRSRGVPLDAARRMLVRAFCAVALDGIEPAALRAECEALLLAQLPEASA